MPAFPSRVGRRRFIRTGLRTALVSAVAPRLLRGADLPSRTLNLGCIGVGAHGHGVNLMSFLHQDGCRVLAVCDVDAERMNRSRREVDTLYGDASCLEFRDFRELIARPDIDAVVISTPDHWHVPMALRALAAGKKVFCEKPTLTIAEGRTLADAVERHGGFFATGLEDRSLIHYHKLAETVRNGAIGRLRHMVVGLPTAQVFPAEAAAPVPPGLDFDFWLGPAPERAYSPSLTLPSVWRQIRDFSGGMLTDWGAHLIDTAQVSNFAENSGPVTVEGRGDIPPDAMNDVPRTFALRYTYANGVTMDVRSDVPSIRLEGTEGWVGNRGWRGQLEASDLEIYRRVYEPAANKIWPRPEREHADFIDAIRKNRAPIYTAEALHRLSTVLHIGAIAMLLRRPLQWDPTTERFADPEANKHLSRESRAWEK